MTEFLNTYFWYHCHSPSPSHITTTTTMHVAHSTHLLPSTSPCQGPRQHIKMHCFDPQVRFLLFFSFFHSILFLAWILFFLLDPSCCPHCPHFTSNLPISRAKITHQNMLFWPEVCVILLEIQQKRREQTVEWGSHVNQRAIYCHLLIAPSLAVKNSQNWEGIIWCSWQCNVSCIWYKLNSQLKISCYSQKSASLIPENNSIGFSVQKKMTNINQT